MLKFEQYVDMKDINDSMLLESGTEICKLTTEKGTRIIEVRGEINIGFQGETYRHVSEFTDELKKVIKNEKLYEAADYVNMNNWFEAFWAYHPDTNDPYDFYDVVEIGNYTPSQLLDTCIECLNSEK